MATSQFTIYSSADAGHPILKGDTTGSFLALMNACLVDGYGSKVGAGWTKGTGSAADSSSCGIFIQPTGSGATLFIDDNVPNATAGSRMARIVGYDQVTNFTASTGPANGKINSIVTGSNPFPTAAQGFGTLTASLAVRKSTDMSNTERQWLVFADSRSVYTYIATGDTAAMYYGWTFGDIYSLKTGSADAFKCLLIGNIAEVAAGTVANDRLDVLGTLSVTVTGHFMQRGFGGSGASLTVTKHGDAIKGSSTVLLGTTQFPNAVDTGLYISPVWVCENATSTVRGRMRGFYQVLHAVAGFSDGQTFTGAGDYSGKTFMVVKGSPNAGLFLMETSNTLETNDN
jgi:hypothetical protein